jgi:hypothetical protein
MAKGSNNVITYSAEFSVALDKLQAGFVETQKILGRIERQFKESGQNTGTWFGEGLRIGLNEAGKSLEKAEKAAKTYAEVTGDTAGAVRQTIQAHKDYIATLVKGAQAIGDEDGSIKKLIATHQQQIRAMEKGKGAADGFGKGIKKGFGEAGKEATKFGANLVKSLGPVGLLLAAISAAVNFFKEKLGNAMAENEAASASFEKVGNIIDAFVKPVFDGLAFVIGKVADGVAWLIDNLTGGGASAIVFAKNFEEARKALDALTETFYDEIKVMNERDTVYGDGTKKSKEYLEEQIAARQKYLDTLIKAKALRGDLLGLLQPEIDGEKKKLDVQKAELAAIENIEKAKAEAARLEEERAKKAEEQSPFIKERNALQEKMNERLRTAAVTASRETDAVERENSLLEARNRIYREIRDELDGIIGKYEATRKNAELTFQFADMLDGKIKETTQHAHELTLEEQFQKELAEADLAIAEARLTAEYKFGRGLIDETQRTEELNAAAEAYNNTLAGLAVKYRNVEGAVERVNKKTIDIPKAEDMVGDLSKVTEQYQNAANSVLAITQRLAEDQIEVINDLLEEQKELIDKQYEDAMKKLDEERQAALEAAGFVQSLTEEGLAASMEAAIASGDEAAIYREKRRQEELAVNKKYDKLEENAENAKKAALKKAEDDAAQQTADIQYKQAMAQWSLQIAMAPAQIASAILKGYELTGIVGGTMAAIIMTAVGAAQVGAIIAAKPKPPALKSGGVIGMPETYRSQYANGGIVMANTPRGVDAIDATLANREMVLNDDQQRNMFNAIASGQLGGGSEPPIINIYFSAEDIAHSTVEYIWNGVTRRIPMRMIEP